ncbi:MAG: threonine synthase, partial [Candidatus Adiutrix sp.]
MITHDFPSDIRDSILPQASGQLVYKCLQCATTYPPLNLYYTCPNCAGLLLLEDLDEKRLLLQSGEYWRKLFDYRRLSNHQSLRGIFTFHEFLAPLIPIDDIIYLGEGHTPVVQAPPHLI